MNSIAFPKIFSNSTTLISDGHEAVAQNLKLLLLTEKTSLFGDPSFGSTLKKLFFEQNNIMLKDIVVDSIYSTIKSYMSNVSIVREDIDIINNRTTLTIKIKAKNLIDYTTDLYSISLTEEELNQWQ